MSVLVDTTQLPERERFEAWAAASLAVFEPIAVTPATQRPFTGRLARQSLGPLQLLHLTADASAARRTRQLIGAGDPETVEVMVQLRGACGVTQDGRSALVRAGHLGSWHSSAPYVVEADHAFQCLIVTCPSVLLAQHANRFRRRTGLSIDGSTGVGSVLRRHLLALRDVLGSGDCPPGVRAHLAESLLDLLRALHAPDAAAASGPQRLRARVDAFIDANLARPDLSRELVARENFLSTSHLDRLFADDELGVWGTIRAKRLDRVRRDLADPALAGDSVFAIASRWGFLSPSHLSRAFRAAYGQPPAAYREAAQKAERAGFEPAMEC